MSENCPFCLRIDRKEYTPTDISDVVMFEPLNPVTPGHMLFVPERHTTWDYPAVYAAAAAADCMDIAVDYAKNNLENFNIITSCGAYATQTVPHIHIHLVPRRKDDGLHLPWTGQHDRN